MKKKRTQRLTAPDNKCLYCRHQLPVNKAKNKTLHPECKWKWYKSTKDKTYEEKKQHIRTKDFIIMSDPIHIQSETPNQPLPTPMKTKKTNEPQLVNVPEQVKWLANLYLFITYYIIASFCSGFIYGFLVAMIGGTVNEDIYSVVGIILLTGVAFLSFKYTERLYITKK